MAKDKESCSFVLKKKKPDGGKSALCPFHFNGLKERTFLSPGLVQELKSLIAFQTFREWIFQLPRSQFPFSVLKVEDEDVVPENRSVSEASKDSSLTFVDLHGAVAFSSVFLSNGRSWFPTFAVPRQVLRGRQIVTQIVFAKCYPVDQIMLLQDRNE